MRRQCRFTAEGNFLGSFHEVVWGSSLGISNWVSSGHRDSVGGGGEVGTVVSHLVCHQVEAGATNASPYMYDEESGDLLKGGVLLWIMDTRSFASVGEPPAG